MDAMEIVSMHGVLLANSPAVYHKMQSLQCIMIDSCCPQIKPHLAEYSGSVTEFATAFLISCIVNLQNPASVKPCEVYDEMLILVRSDDFIKYIDCINTAAPEIESSIIDIEQTCSSHEIYIAMCDWNKRNAMESCERKNLMYAANRLNDDDYRTFDSDRDSDDCEYEMTEQRTNERRVEYQLDEFLNKWKKEIQQRTVYGHVINDKQKQDPEKTINEEEQAIHFFQRASDLEREGKLYDAIKYYRAAMQLVPDIEFRMARKGQQPMTTMESNSQQENNDEANNNNNTNEVSEPDQNLIDALQRAHLDDGELSAICIKNFPQQATHISCLPSEVLIYILRWVVSSDLDIRSLEQCARTCRGFYLCARDPQLWKMICFKTWGVQTGNPSTNINWRYMFINRPHVVFNGVYISRTSYIRQGEQSLDTFYSPWHLVEYYRYMRFFPDGIVVIYTSAEEPRTSVARLKNRYSIRDPALLYGNYRLQNDRVIIVAKRNTQRTLTINNPQRRGVRDAQISDIEQIMNMEFEMCDAGKKKHHQLTWTHYEIKSIDKRTGDERSNLLDAANDRHAYPPLIFSRVKSYSLASEQLLK
ncbi:unnamed protein product [Rotaria magnacalcarata]